MKKCNEITDLISLYLDHQMDDHEKAEFEEHLGSCESCKKELEEMSQLMSILHNIGEEELPSDFKLNLHEKLEDAKVEEDKKSKFKLLGNRYIRICTSIAAGILMILLIKGVIGSNRHMDQYTQSAEMAPAMNKGGSEKGTQNSGTGQVNTQFDEAVSSTLDQETGGTQPVDGSADGNASVAINGKNEVPSTNQASRYLPTGKKPGSGDNKTAAVATVDVTPFPNLTFSDAEGTGSRAYNFANKSVSVRKDTTIAITADKPEEEADKVRNCVTNSGAEFYNDINVVYNTDRNASYSNDTTKVLDAPNMLSTAIGENRSGTTLSIRVHNSKYDELVKTLKTTLSPDQIVFGTLITKDVGKEINDLNQNIAEITNKISQMENDKNLSNPEEMNQLKAQRDNMTKEIDKLKEDTDYIYITITIQKK